MKKLLLSSLLLLVSACGVDKAEAFRKGVPLADDVAFKLPFAAAAQPLSGEGTRRDGLEGQTAELYRLTRDVTVVVNGGTAAVLNLVHRITQSQATTVGADTATWGPHTDPLSPNTWKLTVTRTAPDTYGYLLEGKAKTEADSAYRVVLSGTHAHLGANLGSGTFLVDWNAASQLPEHEAHVGTVAVTYARPSLSSTTQIDAQFTQVRDGASGARVDALYRSVATPGQGGSFEFQLDKDFVGAAALERGQIKSRWLESGAGRGDAQISSGDLSSTVTLSECWDAGFASRYLQASFEPSKDYGTQALCAFATAEYASL